MRVLVCGGRYYAKDARFYTVGTPAWSAAFYRDCAAEEFLEATLSALDPAPTLIIHGAAAGADTLARKWAEENDIPHLPFKANWFPNGRTGVSGGMDKSAGPIRNTKMIREGKPDVVIAFPGGAGTADMCRQAEAAGIPILRPSPTLSKESSRHG